MCEKKDFIDWWNANGNRGISYCEINYDKVPNRQIRKWIKEAKGITNPISNDKQSIIQINDLHIPYHDEKTINNLFLFLNDYKPDQIVIAGDLLDFYDLSRFDHNPDRRFAIQDELDICFEILKELKKYCNDIHFIKGNHEDRLRRFLWKNPSLAGIRSLSLPKLMGLDELGIHYHDYEYIFRGFRFTHGSIVRQESGASAKAELLKYGNSMGSGHTHRIGMYLKTDSRGTIGAYESGCLCDLHPEYVDGTPNWQQGFTIYNFVKDRFFAQMIPILEHKFIYGNTKYGD